MTERKLEDYSYEVAFSFHSKDQPKASRINSLLKDRYKTFIYTEKQKELIGTNGDEKFKKVFQYESRVVVVLYRKEWGNTKWTRAESDAVKARGFENGYDFLILIPTESDIPKWLHPTFIWGNLKRYGIKGVATAIENKIQSLGGEKKDLTPNDIAKWIENKSTFVQKRNSILNSFTGVENANKEIKLLFEFIETKTQSLNNKSLILNFKKHNEKICSVITTNLFMKLVWKNYSWNSLEDRSLEVNIMEPVKRYDKSPYTIKTYNFLFDYSEANEFGWVQDYGDEIFFTSASLADYVLKEFLKIIYDWIK